jgi:hypothetical protein
MMMAAWRGPRRPVSAGVGRAAWDVDVSSAARGAGTQAGKGLGIMTCILEKNEGEARVQC